MSKLQQILIRAKREVFNEMAGLNLSIFNGEGYDFVELREYMAGDDIRAIEWSVTAKMQKPFIKIFNQTRELSVVVVCALSGSLHFGSPKSKHDLMAQIVALLGYSTIKNGDMLSSYMFTDEIVSRSKPTKNMHFVQKSVEDILNFAVLGKKVDYELVSQTLFKMLKRKSLILIVGDFFDVPNFRLLAKKHEVVCVVIRDKDEEKPPKMGFASLIDPQSGAVLDGYFGASAVLEYSKKVTIYDEKLFSTLQKDGIRFAKIYTHATPIVELRRFFEGK